MSTVVCKLHNNVEIEEVKTYLAENHFRYRITRRKSGDSFVISGKNIDINRLRRSNFFSSIQEDGSSIF